MFKKVGYRVDTGWIQDKYRLKRDKYWPKVDGYGRIQDKSRWIWANTEQK